MRLRLLPAMLLAAASFLPLQASTWQGWVSSFIPTWETDRFNLTTYAELRMTDDLGRRDVAILSEKIRFKGVVPTWGPGLNLTYLEINRSPAPGISHWRIEPEVNPILLESGDWKIDGRLRLEFRHIENTSGFDLRQRVKIRATWTPPLADLPCRNLSVHVEGFHVYAADRWTEVRSVPLEASWALPDGHRLGTFFMIQSRYRRGSWQHDPTLGLKAFLRF
ncbi:MAG: hypothetical protein ACFE0O_10385 [Opitutales bacterium]